MIEPECMVPGPVGSAQAPFPPRSGIGLEDESPHPATIHEASASTTRRMVGFPLMQGTMRRPSGAFAAGDEVAGDGGDDVRQDAVNQDGDGPAATAQRGRAVGAAALGGAAD